MLLQCGADIEPAVTTNMPLELAVERKHVEIVRLLLQFGANMHIGTR